MRTKIRPRIVRCTEYGYIRYLECLANAWVGDSAWTVWEWTAAHTKTPGM